MNDGKTNVNNTFNEVIPEIGVLIAQTKFPDKGLL